MGRKTNTLGDAIQSTWSKEYKELKKQIRRFNARHFSGFKAFLWTFIDGVVFVLPILLSLLIYLICVLLFSGLSSNAIKQFDKDESFAFSLTYLGIVSTFFTAIVVAIVISLNKGKSYFGKSENKMFWQTNSYGLFDNGSLFINSLISLLPLLISFFRKDYISLVYFGLWIIVYSILLLMSISV